MTCVGNAAARVVVRDDAGGPVRCAAQALGCAVARSGAATRRVLRRPPETGVPRWADLIMLRTPRRAPLGSPSSWSRRAGWLRRGAWPRRLPRPRPARVCFGSVAVTQDTDGDCDCPACSPSSTHIAEYLRLPSHWPQRTGEYRSAIRSGSSPAGRIGLLVAVLPGSPRDALWRAGLSV